MPSRLDPFNGSGTTGIACLRTKRRYLGIELEEQYILLSAKRFAAELRQQETLF